MRHNSVFVKKKQDGQSVYNFYKISPAESTATD